MRAAWGPGVVVVVWVAWRVGSNCILRRRVHGCVTSGLDSLNVGDSPCNLRLANIFILIIVNVTLVNCLVAHRVVIQAVDGILRQAGVPLLSDFAGCGIFRGLALLMPVAILSLLFPLTLNRCALLSASTSGLLDVTVLIVFASVLFTLLSTLGSVTARGNVAHQVPVGDFIRLVGLFAFFVNVIMSVSVLTGRSPIVFLDKLKITANFIVLMFGSAVLNFITNVRLSTGQVVALGS